MLKYLGLSVSFAALLGGCSVESQQYAPAPAVISFEGGQLVQDGPGAKVLKDTAGILREAATLSCLSGDLTLSYAGAQVELAPSYLQSVAKQSGINDWEPCKGNVLDFSDKKSLGTTTQIAKRALDNIVVIPG